MNPQGKVMKLLEREHSFPELEQVKEKKEKASIALLDTSSKKFLEDTPWSYWRDPLLNIKELDLVSHASNPSVGNRVREIVS